MSSFGSTVIASSLGRAVGSFFIFYGGGLRTNASHHGWPTRKNKKKTLAKKRLIAIPPKNKIWTKICYSKSHIWNSFFENITSGIQIFCICPHVPVDFFFFLVRFSNRKSQSQQKLAKKVTHFIIQFRSKNLTRFTNLNSRTICSRNASKTLSDFTNFPENIFLFGFRHVSVWFHHFLTPKNHILEALWNQMSVYLRKKIFCSRKIVRFYLVGGKLSGAE